MGLEAEKIYIIQKHYRLYAENRPLDCLADCTQTSGTLGGTGGKRFLTSVERKPKTALAGRAPPKNVGGDWREKVSDKCRTEAEDSLGGPGTQTSGGTGGNCGRDGPGGPGGTAPKTSETVAGTVAGVCHFFLTRFVV